jgi:hypothetical protein
MGNSVFCLLISVGISIDCILMETHPVQVARPTGPRGVGCSLVQMYGRRILKALPFGPLPSDWIALLYNRVLTYFKKTERSNRPSGHVRCSCPQGIKLVV